MSGEEQKAGELILIPGVHAPHAEIDFTDQVIRQYIRQLGKYTGQIRLIGSRAEQNPWWISRKRLSSVSSGIPEKDLLYYASEYNKLAKKNDFTRKQIPLLADMIAGAPQIIKSFIKGNFGPPGSDIDLQLQTQRRPADLRLFYEDLLERTGQLVDIHCLGEIRQTV
jgi:hypothetical protein